MTSPVTVNCRGVNLLNLGKSDTGSEDEAGWFVSVHQLSLCIWDLFRVPRGSVQKKINDLGICLRPCTKEGVQILRDNCVITAYKASQLTVGEAELVFDAVKKSRLRRVNSEKRKREHAEKRWLQKMGSGNKNSESSDVVDAVNGLGTGTCQTDENVDECALYRIPSPPISNKLKQGGDGKNWKIKANGKFDQLKNETIMGVDIPFQFSDGKKEEEKLLIKEEGMLQRQNICNGVTASLQERKRPLCNGYKHHNDIFTSSNKSVDKRNGHLSLSDMSECSEDSSLCLGPNEIGNTLNIGLGINSSLDNGGCKRIKRNAEIDPMEKSHKVRRKSSKKKRKVQPAIPKRIVKLRHFAQTTSPKVKGTISKPPCPSVGKRFPGISESGSESLMVSIPRSLLHKECSEISPLGNSLVSMQVPSSTTLVCSSRIQKSGPKCYRGKMKETALSAFASKKRASTHTPSPSVEPPPVKSCGTLAGSLLCDAYLSPPPKSPSVSSSVSVQSGIDINVSSKSKPRKKRGSKSNISSSSSSPQPATPLHLLDSQFSQNGSDMDFVSEMAAQAASISDMNGINDSIVASAAKRQYHDIETDQNNPQKPEESFCFRKHFDSVPPKLVVRNGELCPEVSLSIKGMKLSDVPTSHPIWTWKVGQPTKNAPLPVKVRTTRQKSVKSKPPVL